MGRSTSLSHFVKYGREKAIVEIRLKRSAESVVKVKRTFLKDDKTTGEWFIDGAKSSLHQVQRVISSMKIQLNNLCQFLPQDKVFEFSKLDSVQLLRETQRAVAGEELVDMQKDLIALREDDRQTAQVYTPLHLA
jgi:structural maintenance of chromosomes protein 5